MLGPILLNLLAITRPSYRRDYPSEYSGGGDGDYSIRGYLSRPDDQLNDGRSYHSRQFGFQRSYDRLYGRAGAGTCPYQNQKLSRKRREAGAEVYEEGALKTRLRRQSFQSLYGRRYYDDDNYDRNNFYSRNYRNYRDRYEERYPGRRFRGRERAGYDNCGREVCDWDAELVCPLGYNRNRIIWTREHDAYYPRDKYQDILDYCGGRCDPNGELLRIRNVQPEDKGVYRCYIEGGDERDFKVIQFQPKFPLDSNSNGVDC